ncbi:MAG: hypothetical protein OXC31_07185 [Spirochaetaceae bacterium]|nr:hypothetical protein [Spirochaetaceae bacterium]
MDKFTPTPESDSSPPVETAGATAPALAYTNPQPRLPHSEASPPEQPETFMLRARRVRLGSHRLKLWYLALCTFGRAWVRGDDVLEIGIKQRSLAGELETGLNRVSKVLAELRDTGLVHVSRSKYHSVIRIFLTPQNWADTPGARVSTKAVPLPATPETGVSGNRDTPETGVASTPETGVTNVSRSLLDVQAAAADVLGTPERAADLTRRQQQQQQRKQERLDERVEGLFAAIAARARELGMVYDEADERRRLKAGEIGVDELQALADKLADEIQQRRCGRRRR